MSIEIDYKYFKEISWRLKNLKEEIPPKLYSFICPVCGGSKSRPNKRTAGLFMDKNSEVHFKCLRDKCKATGFGTLIRNVDYRIAKKYWEEKYKWANKNNKELLLQHEENMRNLYH